MSDVLDGVHDYLASGGLFNPELMNHERTRDLIIECRDEIERLRQGEKAADAEIERLRGELIKERLLVRHIDQVDAALAANQEQEIERLHSDYEYLRHQIHFIQDMILRHKAEQTADPRCICSEMDANLWAWAEDREGDLPVRPAAI